MTKAFGALLGATIVGLSACAAETGEGGRGGVGKGDWDSDDGVVDAGIDEADVDADAAPDGDAGVDGAASSEDGGSDEGALDGDGGVPLAEQHECAADAIDALDELETLRNGEPTAFGRVELLDAYSDAAILRVVFADESDAYVVSVESRGGSDCAVYGAQLRSQQTDLEDDLGDGPVGTPSSECSDAAIEAVRILGGYGWFRQVPSAEVELIDAHSDRELLRVYTFGEHEGDSYLVNAESNGGSPCYVYGLQAYSQQLDLTDDE